QRTGVGVACQWANSVGNVPPPASDVNGAPKFHAPWPPQPAPHNCRADFDTGFMTQMVLAIFRDEPFLESSQGLSGHLTPLRARGSGDGEVRLDRPAGDAIDRQDVL